MHTKALGTGAREVRGGRTLLALRRAVQLPASGHADVLRVGVPVRCPLPPHPREGVLCMAEAGGAVILEQLEAVPYHRHLHGTRDHAPSAVTGRRSLPFCAVHLEGHCEQARPLTPDFDLRAKSEAQAGGRCATCDLLLGGASLQWPLRCACSSLVCIHCANVPPSSSSQSGSPSHTTRTCMHAGVSRLPMMASSRAAPSNTTASFLLPATSNGSMSPA